MTGRKTALVTGSCVRTGKAVVLALAARGWRVVVHGKDSSRDEAEAVARECREVGGEAVVALHDISRPEGCQALADAVPEGSLDLLVHNVGIYPRGSALDTDHDTLVRTLGTNLVAPWQLTRALVGRMPAGSSVVALGYVGLQSLAGTRNATAYSVSKTGLLVLVKSLALELGARGIRVNMVSPGQLENSVDLPEDIARRVPLGRAGREADIANAILWLASDEASYVTGQDIDVAGGLMLSLRGEGS